MLLPAINKAENGYFILDRVAFDHAEAVERMKRDEYLSQRFLVSGKSMLVGTKHRQPQMAQTLREIAKNGRAGFYDGTVMEDILCRLNQLGGCHTAEDFEAQACEYVTPIYASYKGHDIFECPPNGQGLAALMMLQTLEGYDVANGFKQADIIHIIAEITKMAYAARDALICDPKFAQVPVDYLLSKKHASLSLIHI